MATRKEQIEFIKKIYPAAYNLYTQQDSIHPLFVTAQAALETGWRHDRPGNNIFGITKGSWTGKTQLVLTREKFKTASKKFYSPEEIVSITPLDSGWFEYRVYRLFRVYDSLEDCLSDHLAVLRKPGYADAWPYRHDPKEYARRIVDTEGAKYATEPGYAKIMSSVIDTVSKRITEIKNEIHTSDPGNIFFRL